MTHNVFVVTGSSIQSSGAYFATRTSRPTSGEKGCGCRSGDINRVQGVFLDPRGWLWAAWWRRLIQILWLRPNSAAEGSRTEVGHSVLAGSGSL